MTQEKEDLKIPVIVGVTGHINIAEDETYIAEQVRLFWQHLREIVGPETPIVLLSSIAKCADHYAVKYRPDDVRYAVVLPFKEEDYRKDFGTGQALTDYENDLHQAFKVIECKAETGNYTAASEYVRTRSDVLLSMWDGRECLDPAGNPKAGGTFDQIWTAFNQNELLIHHQEKSHLIVNLKISRTGNSDGRQLFVQKTPLEVLSFSSETASFYGTPFPQYKIENCKQEMSETEAPSIKKILFDIIQFNKNCPENIQKDLWMEKDILEAIEPLERQQKKLNAVMPDFNRYSYFDKLACQHQTTYRKLFNWILFISFFALLSSQFSGDLQFSTVESTNLIWIHIALFFYLAGLGIAFLMNHFYIKRTDDYSKYCFCRVIAELMRLKIFWSLSGIKEDFSEMLLRESGNFHCILPICNWEVSSPEINSPEIESEIDEFLPTVRIAWLQGQLNYYRKTTVPKYLQYEKRTRFWSNLFYWLSIVMAIFFLLNFFVFPNYDIKLTEALNLSDFKEILISIGPFIFASLGWFLEKKQWKRMADSYAGTADLFELTIKKFKDLEQGVKDGRINKRRCTFMQQELIKELMKICHDENSEWKEIRSNAKPEPMV